MRLVSNPGPPRNIPVLAILLVAICSQTASAAPFRLQQQTAPPPLKIITRAEREQLTAARDDKARVKLTIELAEVHLTNVENQTAIQQYDGASSEIGKYWALIEDLLNYMKTLGREGNRRRDLYKRLELALRAHSPRLNAVRRTTPAEYAVWIKEVETFARDSRTEALNSFYGNTVIRDGPRKTVDGKSADTKEVKKPEL
jgi:hypothetical protein